MKEMHYPIAATVLKNLEQQKEQQEMLQQQAMVQQQQMMAGQGNAPVEAQPMQGMMEVL